MSAAAEVIHVRRNRPTWPLVTSLMATGLAMFAAAVCVVLGEEGVRLSEPLWNVSVDVCRAVTGLLGLLMIKSLASGRRLESSRMDTFWTVVSGVLFIVAAVVGLGLVIVMTGVVGLVLLYAGGTVAVEEVRSPSAPWPQARGDRHRPLDPVGNPGRVVVEVEPDVAVLVVDPREPLVDDLDDRDVAVGR